MIAADSSVIIDFLKQVSSKHTELLEYHLVAHTLILPPVVVTELYGARKTDSPLWKIFAEETALLEIETGYWERAGEIRRKILQQGLKAKLGDALIAQSCIDHDIPLLTRNADFRHYAEHAGLKLALPFS